MMYSFPNLRYFITFARRSWGKWRKPQDSLFAQYKVETLPLGVCSMLFFISGGKERWGSLQFLQDCRSQYGGATYFPSVLLIVCMVSGNGVHRIQRKPCFVRVCVSLCVFFFKFEQIILFSLNIIRAVKPWKMRRPYTNKIQTQIYSEILKWLVTNTVE